MIQSPGIHITLDRGRGTSLYQQVRDQIARSIASGELPPGSRLPASRELARALRVNRATVASAYESLATEGLVRSHVGQGTFVLGPSESAKVSPMSWPACFSRAMESTDRMVSRDFSPHADHPDSIDFAALIPDEELFPIEPFRKVLNGVVRRQGKELLQYGPVSGYPPLREYIARRLSRGVRATPDEVLVVNGSQQGLDLIFRALVNPGDAVAVESPTYYVVLSVAAHYQAQVVGIPMTGRGMDLDALEAALRRRQIKLIYTMPTFHNPTGITMDLEARRHLLQLARRHQVPLVEDDFESELRYDGRAVAPLRALDETGLVLYLGTFSKGLFPGLRLGWILGPLAAIRALSRVKKLADYHTSLLLQAAVLEFCRRGYFDRHLRSLARVNREKSRRLVEAMSKHLPPQASWTLPQGGYAFWVTLPEGVSVDSLMSDGQREGVLFTPGGQFFCDGRGDRYLRLSISRVPLERMEEGVRRLATLIRRQLDRGSSGPSRAEAAEPAFHI